MNQAKLFSAPTTILACALWLALGTPAVAQQMDVAIGISTTTAPSASEAGGNHAPQSLTGGAYPSFSADLVLFKNFGVQGESGPGRQRRQPQRTTSRNSASRR